jgi:Protein of unknown function (DUF3417)
VSNPVYTRRPAETLGSDALAELALDLRWSFNHAADTIWQQLDPVLWNLTHNPWFVLQTVSRERLDAVTADSEFQQLSRVERLHSPILGRNEFRRIIIADHAVWFTPADPVPWRPVPAARPS